MPRYRLIALCLGLATVCAHGQQAVSTSSVLVQANAQPVHVKVYSKDPGLAPPQLLPLTLAPLQVDKCIRKIDGDIELSLLVDTEGAARNIVFIHPVGSDADKFALKIAAADRFTPGTLDGKPVVTAASLKVKIQSCVVEVRQPNGEPTYTAKLRAAPTQKLGGPVGPPAEAVLISPITDWESFVKEHPRIKPMTKPLPVASNSAGGGSSLPVMHPIPIFQPEATFTEDARKKKINGSCLITLIVDEQGMPQVPKIELGLDPGLDLNALAAVSRYRFKPAMRGVEPVPVWITIEVTFKIW